MGGVDAELERLERTISDIENNDAPGDESEQLFCISLYEWDAIKKHVAAMKAEGAYDPSAYLQGMRRAAKLVGDLLEAESAEEQRVINAVAALIYQNAEATENKLEARPDLAPGSRKGVENE